MTAISRNNYLQANIPFGKMNPVFGEFDSILRPNYEEALTIEKLNPVMDLYFEKLNKHLPKEQATTSSKPSSFAFKKAKMKVKTKTALALLQLN